ncbi:MAG TPA: hypothetical protein DE061_00770, partial [Clostridiales bacterium]|nr:hypothetical protein [Clostridiales bacterium]
MLYNYTKYNANCQARKSTTDKTQFFAKNIQKSDKTEAFCIFCLQKSLNKMQNNRQICKNVHFVFLQEYRPFLAMLKTEIEYFTTIAECIETLGYFFVAFSD